MNKNNYIFNELTNWEAHLPETSYLGGSPPHKLLKSHKKISTGLIIKSWLPNWKINISEDEANQCLKSILEDVEKFGFKFYGDIQDNLIIGEFRNG